MRTLQAGPEEVTGAPPGRSHGAMAFLTSGRETALLEGSCAPGLKPRWLAVLKLRSALHLRHLYSMVFLKHLCQDLSS